MPNVRFQSELVVKSTLIEIKVRGAISQTKMRGGVAAFVFTNSAVGKSEPLGLRFLKGKQIAHRQEKIEMTLTRKLCLGLLAGVGAIAATTVPDIKKHAKEEIRAFISVTRHVLSQRAFKKFVQRATKNHLSQSTLRVSALN
jgi:hypothetical protein